jgi:hypothetical protein
VTHQIREIIGWVAAGISFLAYPIYIVEYVGRWTKTHPLTRWMWKCFGLHGATAPHQASWLIWAGLQYIIFRSSRDQGASATTWIILGYLIGSIANAILLFWYGEKKWGWLDYSCLMFGAVSLVLLYVQHNLFWALVLSITADGIAAIPTVIGVTKNPRDESRVGWSLFLFGALINTLAINTWNFQEAGYTIYLLVVIGYVTIHVWRPRHPVIS